MTQVQQSLKSIINNPDYHESNYNSTGKTAVLAAIDRGSAKRNQSVLDQLQPLSSAQKKSLVSAAINLMAEDSELRDAVGNTADLRAIISVAEHYADQI
ncbi:MAG: hypothetical protein KTR20_07385 [Cellvibrionaceae bacterium]|nr:hypothetical protein [Cellvibrionaceae bacterium]